MFGGKCRGSRHSCRNKAREREAGERERALGLLLARAEIERALALVGECKDARRRTIGWTWKGQV